MKLRGCFIALCFFVVSLAIAAPKAAEEGDDDDRALTIMAKHCAGCHQAAGHPGALFLNRSSLSEKETLTLLRHLVEHRQMPIAHGNFIDSEDGKFFLKWLKTKEEAANKAPSKKTKVK